MTRIFTHLLLSCALFLMAPTHGQTDDDYLLQLVNQAEPGAHINIDRNTLNLSKKVSFNKKNLGVSVNFNGAKVNIVSSEAGFEFGQSGSTQELYDHYDIGVKAIVTGAHQIMQSL